MNLKISSVTLMTRVSLGTPSRNLELPVTLPGMAARAMPTHFVVAATLAVAATG